MRTTEEPLYRSTGTIRSISVVNDISIEEHFHGLRSSIWSISGLVRMVILIRSTFTGCGASIGVYTVCGV